MCLILFAYRVHPVYSLILAANRDEYYSRPAAPAGFWPDHPDILGGRDLQNMGTWLGITKTGKFAALTNFRSPDSVIPEARSRGELVQGYLTQAQPPALFLEAVAKVQHMYNGFNLLVGDHNSLWYYGKKEGQARELSPGLYGLSNHLLNTAWPKVSKGMAGLRNWLGRQALKEEVDISGLFALLQDPEPALERDLPNTGVNRDWERLLSPVFIRSLEYGYGTRCSTILLVGEGGQVSFRERTFSSLPDQGYQDKSFVFYLN